MDFELKRMETWEKIVPQFKYNKELPFFEMLVPTVDTVRYGYLLEKLLAVNQSVLYTGNTGVGKVCGLYVDISECVIVDSGFFAT
jgi:dynein heavy chain, axonemal